MKNKIRTVYVVILVILYLHTIKQRQEVRNGLKILKNIYRIHKINRKFETQN